MEMIVKGSKLDNMLDEMNNLGVINIEIVNNHKINDIKKIIDKICDDENTIKEFIEILHNKNGT
jgi:hypothetical protein